MKIEFIQHCYVYFFLFLTENIRFRLADVKAEVALSHDLRLTRRQETRLVVVVFISDQLDRDKKIVL